mmetsp:Transcript_12392/g.34805  ORF Transcript_12392/g.34805 Transcript_12392/m.34805 type:complete len:216 (-) Transcript_12392:1217-1864(-)
MAPWRHVPDLPGRSICQADGDTCCVAVGRGKQHEKSQLIPLEAGVPSELLKLGNILVTHRVSDSSEVMVQRLLLLLLLWLLSERRRPLARDLHMPHTVVCTDELENVLRAVGRALEPVWEVPVASRVVLHGRERSNVVVGKSLGQHHIHLDNNELVLQQVGQIPPPDHFVECVLQVQRVQAGPAGVDRQNIPPSLLGNLSVGILINLPNLSVQQA